MQTDCTGQKNQRGLTQCFVHFVWLTLLRAKGLCDTTPDRSTVPAHPVYTSS